MRFATHNVWVGQTARLVRGHVRRLVDELEEPHVLALQEAARYDGAPAGYDRYALDTGHPEHSNNVLLVRKDLKVTRAMFVQPKGPDWIGPKHGLTHPPRVFPGVRIKLPDMTWCVLGVHGIPNRKRNPVAASHEWAALAEWFDERRPALPTVALGDWNADRTSPTLLRFAVRNRLNVRLRGIDGALVRNCRVTGMRKLPDLYGSDDHRPVAFEAIERTR